MAITKKPSAKTVDSFIGAAPDASAAAEKRPGEVSELRGKRGTIVRRGNNAQITLTLPPDLLQRVDARAEELGLSRTALIKFAVSKALEDKVA